jgi:hypothetical protein
MYTMPRENNFPVAASQPFESLVSDIGASTPVVRLAVCCSQPKETFLKRKRRRSINETHKLFISKSGTSSNITLIKVISISRDTAREPSTAQADPSRCTFPLFRWLADNTDICWRRAGRSGTIVVDDNRGRVSYGLVSN